MNFFKKHIILTLLLVLFSGYVYWNYTRIVPTNPLIDTSHPHYINSLYMSNDFIYDTLSENSKKAYDYLLGKMLSYESFFDIPFEEFSCTDYSECFSYFNTAFSAIQVEHPELMNLSNYSIKHEQENDYVSAHVYYAQSFPLLVDLGELRIQRILADMREDTKDMTDEEKIKYVYDWIGQNTSYDTVFTSTSKNQSIYNVFINKNAVCAGFAKACTVIFQNIGIEAYAVTGYSTGPHMWNIIGYQDHYYYFDATVAVSIQDSSYNQYYDGLRQEYMNFYTVDYPEWYPEVEKTNMFVDI